MSDFSDCSHGTVVRLEDIIQYHPLNNDDHIIREIHNILKSYYKLSRKRFVDNIGMQGADFHLLAGPETPLKLFSPKFVAVLTAEKLENIAGEELGIKRKRVKLGEEIQLLKEGKRIP